MASAARHLALFYLTYFSMLGVFVPYLSLYYLDIGLTAYQIGTIAAIMPMTSMITSGMWGVLADRLGTRRALMCLTCVGALGAFALMLVDTDYRWIVLVITLYTAFRSCILPMVEATSMEAVDRLGVDYGRIRMWGSLGFIAATLLFGPVLDRLPSQLVLWVVLALLALVLWPVWHLPDTDAPGEPHPKGATRALLTSRPVLLFYLVCVLMQASHGAYYGFYSVYLEGMGYSRGAIGMLWALGVGAEVAVLAFSGSLLKAVGTRRMILLSLALTVLRWAILASATHPAWLFGAQLLHAASFGLFHVAAVTYTHRIMPARLRATGQSLYSSLSFGLGLTLATYLCGLFYAQAGARALFGASALVALCAGLLAIGLRPSPERAGATG